MRHFTSQPSSVQDAPPTKGECRRTLKREIAQMGAQARQDESAALAKLLSQWAPRKGFQTVLACLPDELEPDVTPFLRQCLETGVAVGFPRLREGGTLQFFLVADLNGPWERHRLGVLQPPAGPNEWNPDSGRSTLLLVPGLGFAPGGVRLGRGGGYFDRFLAHRPAHLLALGLAFSPQVCRRLPALAHDELLDGLILGAKSAILDDGVHLWH